MPSISAVGKRSPTSTTTMRSSYSRTIMFLPISPSPPRGRTRSVPATVPLRARGLEEAVALERGADRRRLLLVGVDQWQAQSAGREAEEVQRGLDRDRVGRHRQRVVDVAQLGVDLPRAVRLV